MIEAALARRAAIPLSTRVSVFTKVRRRDRKEVLASTRFRFHGSQEKCNPGVSEYELDGEGVGIARAIRLKQAIFISGLPDPKANLPAYKARLESEWGVPERLVSQWRRLPRTIVALPFGIAEFKDLEPEGCLCIDLDSPLS